MMAPASMFIEAAADEIDSAPQFIRDSQRKELHTFGDVAAQRIGASGISEDFQRGYELGLQTARVCLSVMPAALAANINL